MPSTVRFGKRIAVLLCVGFTCASTAQIPAAPANGRLAVTPQTSMQQIRNAPAGTMIETRKGVVISKEKFVRLADAFRNAQKVTRVASPGGFSQTQATPTIVVRPGTHLPSLLTRPDGDVVQLPNGQKLTVGDIKKLASISPKLQGRMLVPANRPDLSGSATRINTGADLASLRMKPDNTILENANGVRVTLGELRAAAKAKKN